VFFSKILSPKKKKKKMSENKWVRGKSGRSDDVRQLNQQRQQQQQQNASPSPVNVFRNRGFVAPGSSPKSGSSSSASKSAASSLQSFHAATPEEKRAGKQILSNVPLSEESSLESIMNLNVIVGIHDTSTLIWLIVQIYKNQHLKITSKRVIMNLIAFKSFLKRNCD
jgi:hypothetical protein